jgi:hypothetical protein
MKNRESKVYAQLSTALLLCYHCNLNFRYRFEGVDYQTTTEQIIIPAGAINNFVTDFIGRPNVELTETIIVEITAADNATIDGVQKITLSIENLNKPAASFTVSKNTIAEKEEFYHNSKLGYGNFHRCSYQFKTKLFITQILLLISSKGTATTVAGGNGLVVQ